MHKAADIFETCPICEYSLYALPNVRRCPQCGFQYDRDMQVIRQSSRHAVLALALAVVPLTCGVAAILSGKAVNLLQVLEIVGLAAAGFIAWRVILGHRNKAILWPGGIVLIGRARKPERFSWKQVHRINYAWFGGAAQLIANCGTTIANIEQDFFGSNAKTLAFIKAAKEWRARYKEACLKQQGDARPGQGGDEALSKNV